MPGATRVDIATATGGADLVLVEDDGCGMDAEDLALAVLRHATSKLPFAQDGADDLSHIATLGFRGEALPSIGSVGKLTIASRTATGAAHRDPRRSRARRGAFANRFSRVRTIGYPRRSARAVFCHARPPQIPEIGALRRSGDSGCRQNVWRWRAPTLHLFLPPMAGARSTIPAKVTFSAEG